MTDYRNVSLWFDQLGETVAARPALSTSISADVAIVGAGFTGLWTAYYLQQADPSLRITILESDVAGFGASGRNGGWCSALYPVHYRDTLAAEGGGRGRRDRAVPSDDGVGHQGRAGCECRGRGRRHRCWRRDHPRPLAAAAPASRGRGRGVARIRPGSRTARRRRCPWPFERDRGRRWHVHPCIHCAAIQPSEARPGLDSPISSSPEALQIFPEQTRGARHAHRARRRVLHARRAPVGPPTVVRATGGIATPRSWTDTAVRWHRSTRLIIADRAIAGLRSGTRSDCASARRSATSAT